MDLNLGERDSRVTRDDGTVTLCALRAATVPSRNCRAGFGRPLTTQAMLHLRDGPGVTAPLRTNIAPLMEVSTLSPFHNPSLTKKNHAFFLPKEKTAKHLEGSIFTDFNPSQPNTHKIVTKSLST